MSIANVTLVLVVIIIAVIFVTRFLSYRRKKHLEIIEKLERLLVGIRRFDAEIERNRKKYFRHSQMLAIQHKYSDLFDEVKKYCKYKIISRNSQATRFIMLYGNLPENITDWNKVFVASECILHNDYFGNIAGRSLDQQQRESVVSDEDNGLTVAGAGSGKTLTIVAKVKYLVQKRHISPNQILLIAFTKKAAEELQTRIKKELEVNLPATTFHALGLSIINKALKRRPDVFDDLDKVITEYFKNNILKDKAVCEQILHFFAYFVNIPVDHEKLDNKGQAIDQYRQMDLETLKSKFLKSEVLQKAALKTYKGEKVKSFEEWQIANYLFMHNIEYEYERLYPLKYAGNDKYRKRYRPDFYLPEYDIWLEHFGINEDGRVKWLTPIEEEKYLESMAWKREVHKKYGSTLIETYSYLMKKGLLIESLESLLRKNRIRIGEIDKTGLYDALYRQDEEYHFKEFKKLIESFINLFKSNGYNEKDFITLTNKAAKSKSPFMRKRSLTFLDIIKPIILHYQKTLAMEDAVDFNDMIIQATNIVRTSSSRLKYKYIIIDEYQDISVSRFELIRAIRDMSGAATYCVGDDFQSIYRFAGSEIELFTNFSKHLGYSCETKIEKTYRNSQELVNIAGGFIMKNDQQIKKNLISEKSISEPIRIYEYIEELSVAFFAALDKIALEDGSSAEIMVIGRNNFDVEKIFEGNESKIRMVRAKDGVKLVYKKYSGMKIAFMTAHKSKGLESDNVIVINLRNNLVGFPNKISDDPVLGLIREDSESFEYAEERRLFYVALTRTRNRCILLSSQSERSVFVKELIKDFDINPEFLTDEVSLSENPKCPECQEGYLVLRESRGRGFVACTNWPYCDFTNSNIKLLDIKKVCGICHGLMVERIGRDGKFYGCTNYPRCRNTVRIEDEVSKSYV